MKAKEYMLKVKKLDALINNKMAELDYWKCMATGTTAHSEGERVKSSGNQQKMAAAVAKYVDMEADIDACIDRLADARKEIIAVVEQLPVVEYDMLHMVYIQQKSLYDVALKYKKSYRWATSVHGRALAKVQKIIDERMEGQ